MSIRDDNTHEHTNIIFILTHLGLLLLRYSLVYSVFSAGLAWGIMAVTLPEISLSWALTLSKTGSIWVLLLIYTWKIIMHWLGLGLKWKLQFSSRILKAAAGKTATFKIRRPKQLLQLEGIESRKLNFSIHGVWKSQKKSHSTLRAKRATYTFWVDKS